MTSNMGAHIIQENFENMDMEQRDRITENTKTEVLSVLKQSVRPEFINRIDEIIMFTPLNKEEITEIVKIQLRNLATTLAENNIIIEFSKEAITSLSLKGYDPQYGARPVKRVIQKEILNALSKEILSGTIAADSHILLDAFDDKIVFRNK